MSARRRRASAGVVAVAAVCATACDVVFTDPAPAPSEVAISFALEGASAAGSAAAFERVNRVFLRFTRTDNVQRDTILRAVHDATGIRTRLLLQTAERIPALGIYAELRAGEAPLFAGARVVRVELGAPTVAEVPLTPVPAFLRTSRPSLTLQTVGDTARISAAALFATGDTLLAPAGEWFSANPDVVLITPAGLAIGRAVGQTAVVVRFQALADTLIARVLDAR